MSTGVAGKSALDRLLEATWDGRRRAIRGRELRIEVTVTLVFLLATLILLLAGLSGVAVGVLTAANSKTDLPITSAALAVPLGLLALLLVVYRLLDPVGGLDRRFGLYLGLVAAAAVTYGCWRSIRDERTR